MQTPLHIFSWVILFLTHKCNLSFFFVIENFLVIMNISFKPPSFIVFTSSTLFNSFYYFFIDVHTFFDHKKYDPYNHDSRYFHFVLHAMMSTTQCIECNGVERRYFYDYFHFHKNDFFWSAKLFFCTHYEMKTKCFSKWKLKIKVNFFKYMIKIIKATDFVGCYC